MNKPKPDKVKEKKKEPNWLFVRNGRKGWFVVDGNTNYESYDWVCGKTKEEAIYNYLNNIHQD